MKRYWLLVALALVLMLGVTRAFAGPLTAGNYTFIVSGQELDLPIDILVVQGQPLVPEEMLAALQIPLTVEEGAVRIERSPAAAHLKLGSSLLEAEGRTIRMKSFPIRVSGRTFVPAEALSYLGYQVSVDTGSGAMVLTALQQVTRELETTVVMVTHDMEVAQTAHRIVRIRDGKISTETVRGPARRRSWTGLAGSRFPKRS